MTPFGQAIRALRTERGLTQRDMAEALGVSSAYLSALEHGHRSAPSWEFVQKVIGYFNIIWDEAEELQRVAGLSDPRITIDTAGLPSIATETANRFASAVGRLNENEFQAIAAIIENATSRDD